MIGFGVEEFVNTGEGVVSGYAVDRVSNRSANPRQNDIFSDEFLTTRRVDSFSLR